MLTDRRVFAAAARRLVAEDRGQDLIEYALLASIVAAAGVAFIPSIQDKIGAFVSSRWIGFSSNVQGLWVPPDPQ